jgi:hypothetical protein
MLGGLMVIATTGREREAPPGFVYNVRCTCRVRATATSLTARVQHPTLQEIQEC